jgi:tRNA threonylcarbamoyladenosine biosynthesis protein TsaB
MNILAIETTGPFASVAVIDGDGCVSEICFDQRMNHLKGLSAMIGKLFSENGLSIGDIQCVAASEGPGSFTGIRIGVSTARALAQAWGILAMGVPTLAGFVYNMPSYRGAVCPVFDARREQLYCGVFVPDGGARPVTLIEGAARSAAELRLALDGLPACPRLGQTREIRFFGDGIEVCGDMIGELRGARPGGLEVSLAPFESRFQRASSVARLARFMLRNPSARVAESASYSDLFPVYMRQAEAERKLAEAMQAARL